jgi:tetratricopeptide (TPR) repeat protein
LCRANVGQQAVGYHRRALGLFREIGDRTGEAETLNGLGEVFLATGRPGQARRHWQEALTLYTTLGAPEAGQIRAQLTRSKIGSVS